MSDVVTYLLWVFGFGVVVFVCVRLDMMVRNLAEISKAIRSHSASQTGVRDISFSEKEETKEIQRRICLALEANAMAMDRLRESRKDRHAN